MATARRGSERLLFRWTSLVIQGDAALVPGDERERRVRADELEFILRASEVHECTARRHAAAGRLDLAEAERARAARLLIQVEVMERELRSDPNNVHRSAPPSSFARWLDTSLA